MNKFYHIIASAAAILTLGSCEQELSDPIAPDTPGQGGFTLVATYGDPASKAAFGENGLDMVWTPGDVLYMIDPAELNSTIELTTDITNPTGTATFHTDEIVPTGEYIVVFGQDDLEVEKDLQIKSSPSDLNDQIRLYGNVSVTRGQTSASITLNQLYAMLSFNFANVPSGYENGLNLGMAVCAKGLKYLDRGVITARGMQTGYSGTFVTTLGQIDGTAGCTFVAPADFRNNGIIFFASGTDADSNLYVYEVSKAGIDMQAGKRYTINIDFAAGTTRRVALMQGDGGGLDLRSTDDFLAAALAQWDDRLCLQNDVDFSGEVFLPLKARFLDGNGHKLSYIQCGLDHCDNVGVVSDGGVSGLTVEGAHFSGALNVGAIAGSGYCRYCKCIDVGVIGESNVGGLVGSASNIVANSSLLGTCSVYGVGCMGGIAGSSSKSVMNCVAKGNIVISGSTEEADYFGGIVGKADGGVVECGFEGSLYGVIYSGGVAGKGSCTRCYSVGEISGTDYVGGVTGDGNCYDCYHIGSVCGDTPVGGISGSADVVEVTNCYSCGDVIGGSAHGAHGICKGTTAETRSTNLTSFNDMYETGSPEGLYNCTDFLAQLSVINDNKSYLDICWPDKSYNCPILEWQFEGFGADITIPSFESAEW